VAKILGVAGGAIMGEILACPSAPLIGEISVALLDCHDIVLLAHVCCDHTEVVQEGSADWRSWIDLIRVVLPADCLVLSSTGAPQVRPAGA
jgi:hypothetical protein